MTGLTRNLRKDIGRYCLGLLGAGLLTLLSYSIVVGEWFTSATTTAAVILVLAGLQLICQLYFFLHLTDETKPRWQTYSFLFTAMMLLIVVVGSIWIMMHLNYRMGMSGEQMDQYMKAQQHEGF